jgi:hypothetical protein
MRPRRRGAAEEGDEVAPLHPVGFHSMTSSAMAYVREMGFNRQACYSYISNTVIFTS